MGWIKERVKAAGHGIEKGVKSFFNAAKDQGFYAGYHANGDGTNGEYYIQAGPISYGTNSGININTNTTQTQQIRQPNSQTYKPPAYSRVSAATAKDIAQGGMTKNEVQEFNIKHPNETALRG